jgi:hypothetical protein
MPAFVRSVKESFAGFGAPGYFGTVIGTSLTGATPAAIVIPATGATTPAGGTAFNTSGSPAPTRGKFRIRTSAVNAATVDTVTVSVTDGTTTLVVDILGPTAAGAGIDYSSDFNTDLSITSISFTFVQSGATTQATADVEVALT